MEKRPERPQMPTGEELARSIQEKFIRDCLPALEENERWRRDSRRHPGDWPAPRPSLDESD